MEKSTHEQCVTVGIVRRPHASRPLGMMPRTVSQALTVYSIESGAQCIVEVISGWCRVPLEADMHHVMYEMLTQRNAPPSRYSTYVYHGLHLWSAVSECELLLESSDGVMLGGWQRGWYAPAEIILYSTGDKREFMVTRT
jgi:hypothetical protein